MVDESNVVMPSEASFIFNQTLQVGFKFGFKLSVFVLLKEGLNDIIRMRAKQLYK